MVRIYDKLQRAVEQLVYFATRQWQFESTNLPKLLDQLSPTDKEVGHIMMIREKERERVTLDTIN